MTTETTLLVADASTGNRLAELPWSGMQRSRVLSGAGNLTCTLPLEHPAVTASNLGLHRSSPDREVICFRGDDVKWAGYISGSQCSWADGVFNLVAREFPWIVLAKRVLEEDVDLDGDDPFDIFRWWITYATSKVSTAGDSSLTAGSDILAAVDRLSVDPASADAGVTYTFANSPTVYGTDRKTGEEIIGLVSTDTASGFEYRTAYTGSGWLNYQRVFELGQPGVGTTLTRQMTQWLVSNYGKSFDGEHAATRVHGMSSEGPVTRQSASMVSNGALLLEAVEDMTDLPADVAVGRVKELRRILRSPGPRTPDITYIPDDPLPYGFADIGDTWPFDITEPDALTLTSDSRRVVEENVACDVDGSESVGLTFNDRLDDVDSGT